jgi:hypothetical protein
MPITLVILERLGRCANGKAAESVVLGGEEGLVRVRCRQAAFPEPAPRGGATPKEEQEDEPLEPAAGRPRRLPSAHARRTGAASPRRRRHGDCRIRRLRHLGEGEQGGTHRQAVRGLLPGLRPLLGGRHQVRDTSRLQTHEQARHRLAQLQGSVGADDEAQRRHGPSGGPQLGRAQPGARPQPDPGHEEAGGEAGGRMLSPQRSSTR